MWGFMITETHGKHVQPGFAAHKATICLKNVQKNKEGMLWIRDDRLKAKKNQLFWRELVLVGL